MSRRRRGQALVEFCLVLPILLLFLGLVVDVARYMHALMTLEASAKDAGQYAVLKDPATGGFPTGVQVDNRVKSSLPSWVETVSLGNDVNAVLNGEPAVRIRLSTPLKAFVPLGGLIADPFIVTAEGWFSRR